MQSLSRFCTIYSFRINFVLYLVGLSAATAVAMAAMVTARITFTMCFLLLLIRSLSCVVVVLLFFRSFSFSHSLVVVFISHPNNAIYTSKFDSYEI